MPCYNPVTAEWRCGQIRIQRPSTQHPNLWRERWCR